MDNYKTIKTCEECRKSTSGRCNKHLDIPPVPIFNVGGVEIGTE